jgi:hypothetical protein
MSNVVFATVNVGDVFTYSGEQWEKTEKVKISCCRFNNAVSVNDPKKKIGVKDNESVEVST